jgi:hypothetical protein
VNWGSGGGWAGSSSGSLTDSVEVDFSGSKTIDEVDVFTIQVLAYQLKVSQTR